VPGSAIERVKGMQDFGLFAHSKSVV